MPKLAEGWPDGLLVDAEDRALVQSRRWYIDSFGYLNCRHGRLHRFLIQDVPKGYVVDHINRNKLDNRRANLRVVPISANIRNQKVSTKNKTGHTGVFCAAGRYIAQARVDGIRKHIGSFDTPEAAAAAREAWLRDNDPYFDALDCSKNSRKEERAS